MRNLSVITAQGLGDAVWSCAKIEALAKSYNTNKVDLKIACWRKNDPVEGRSLEFLRRFKFINSTELYQMVSNGNKGPVLLPGPMADENGYYRYIADGVHPELPGIDYVLIANTPLERGIRLENWLPELEVNWNIMDSFEFKTEELKHAEKIVNRIGPFVAFYCSSLNGNTIGGHNRNALWKPEDWVELGEEIHKKYNVSLLICGTHYDDDYYYQKLRPLIKNKPYWHNYLSRWGIVQTYAVLKHARFIVSYQSGIGIVGHYLGIPVAMFWRPKGDSIVSNDYVSFEESMATAWAKPDWQTSGKLMPCIYGKDNPNTIIEFAEKHKW